MASCYTHPTCSLQNEPIPVNRLTEVIIRPVITRAVAQYKVCGRGMSNNTEMSTGTCRPFSRSARPWSISAKMNQKRNFNFCAAVLIRESSKLLETTSGRAGRSISHVLECRENRFHYLYLATESSLRNHTRSDVQMLKRKETTFTKPGVYTVV